MEVRNIEYTITVDTGSSVRKVNNLAKALGNLNTAGKVSATVFGGGSGGSGGSSGGSNGGSGSGNGSYSGASYHGGGTQSGKSTKTTAGALSGIGKAAEAAGKGIQHMFKPLSDLTSRFKRLVGYRILRSIITGIAASFSEGWKNMYEWNKTLNGDFAAAMDSLASSALTFKNSLAVASAPLIEWLAPQVATLAAWFADLATNVSRFFAILTGADHYYQATTASVTAYGNAAGSAAKKVRTLLKFDEINRLERRNQGSGSGGSGGYSGGGFEEVPLDIDPDMDFWTRLKLAIESWDFDLNGLFSGDNMIVKFIAAISALKLAGVVADKFGVGKLALTFLGMKLGFEFGKLVANAMGIKSEFGQEIAGAIGAAVLGGLIASVMWSPQVGLAVGIVTGVGLIIKALASEEGKEWLAEKANAIARFIDLVKSAFTGEDGFEKVEWGHDGLTLGVQAKAAMVVEEAEASMPDEDLPKTAMDGVKDHFKNVPVPGSVIVGITKADPTMPGSTENYWKDKIAQMFNDTQVNASVTVSVRDVVVKKGRDPVPPVYEMSDLHTSLSRVSIGKTNMAAMSVSQGDLFMANEAGVEMVGRVGSRTATANNDQIIQGITNGVANANQQQNALLREQNAILRQLLNKGTNITTGSLSSAFERANRREGSTIIAVGG